MTLTASDHGAAHDAVRRVLDRVGLPTYLFAVHAVGAEWLIELEHPRDGRWCEVTLRSPRAELISALGDPASRERLAARWGEALSERAA